MPGWRPVKEYLGWHSSSLCMRYMFAVDDHPMDAVGNGAAGHPEWGWGRWRARWGHGEWDHRKEILLHACASGSGGLVAW